MPVGVCVKLDSARQFIFPEEAAYEVVPKITNLTFAEFVAECAKITLGPLLP
jgi:hypothetical protein